MIGLWCYIEGKTDCFIVFISPDSYISEPKEQIYIKGSNSFVGCDFMDLNLIKVRYVYHDLYVGVDVTNASVGL